MATERYPGQRSEYGGGDGIQRMPDGSYRALQDLPSQDNVSERARLMRTAGLNDFDPGVTPLIGRVAGGIDLSTLSFAEREAYEAELAESERRKQERADLMDRTNGYIGEPSTYIGESGEDNGVTTDMAEGNASP